MGIALFIVLIVALVVVHELGHFSAAKFFRMRVDEFGVGFPPRLLSVRRGETEYSLNLLFLGGFVRIFGENPDEPVSGPDVHRSFSRGTKGAQAVVLAAGVAANVLFAWALFSGGFMVGMPVSADNTRFGTPTDVRLTVAGVMPDSPAARAGLSAGDAIVSARAGDEALLEPTPETFSALLARVDGPVSLDVQRGGESLTLSAESVRGLFPDEPERAGIGISMGLSGTVALPFPAAVVAGAELTLSSLRDVTLGIASFIGNAFLFRADFSTVAGPVGIAAMAGDASALGLSYLLTFAAFISINLAVINLIPFPALDGGRLLIVGVEALARRAVPPRAISAFNALGFGLLILLMLVVTYHDVARLFA